MRALCAMNDIEIVKKGFPYNLLPGLSFLLTTFLMVLLAKVFGPEMVNFSVSFLPQVMISLLCVYFVSRAPCVNALFSIAVIIGFIPISFYLGLQFWLFVGLPPEFR